MINKKKLFKLHNIKLKEPIFIVIIFSIILLTGIIGNLNKKNLQIDEIYSYGSSNSSTAFMHFEFGKTYQKGTTPFEEYIIVQPNHQFQYENTWNNQKADVHPPLYYLFLHTICSLTPGKFTIWNGAVVNILCFLIMELLLIKLGKILFNNKISWAFLLCIFIALMPVVLDALTLARMYSLLVTISIWSLIQHIIYLQNPPTNIHISNTVIQLYLSSTLGVLVHYYFIIFLFFEFVYLLFVLIKTKNFTAFKIYTLTLIISALTISLIWPTIFLHFFSTGRGQESFENLTSANNYWQQLFYQLSQLNINVLGGTAILWLILICILFYLIKKTKRTLTFTNKNIQIFLLLVFVSFGYFLLISKISVNSGANYFYLTYFLIPIIIISIIYTLYSSFDSLIIKRFTFISSFFLILFCSINGHYNKEPLYLYSHDPNIKIAKKYSDSACIYIGNSNSTWIYQTEWFLLRNYSSITFADENNLEVLDNLMEQTEEVVIYISDGCNKDIVLSQLLARYPHLSKAVDIGESIYSKAYLFWK